MITKEILNRYNVSTKKLYFQQILNSSIENEDNGEVEIGVMSVKDIAEFIAFLTNEVKYEIFSSSYVRIFTAITDELNTRV